MKYYMGFGHSGDKLYIQAPSSKAALSKMALKYLGRQKKESVKYILEDNGVPDNYSLKPISRNLFLKKKEQAHRGKDYGSFVSRDCTLVVLSDDTPGYGKSVHILSSGKRVTKSI